MYSTRRIVFAASVALCAGLTLVVLVQGFSIDPTVKAVETRERRIAKALALLREGRKR